VDVEGVLYTDSDVDIAVLKLVNEVGIEPVTIGQAAIPIKEVSPLLLDHLWDCLIQYPQELYLISGRPMELT